MIIKIKQIIKLFLYITSMFFSIGTVILSFISWEDIGIKSVCQKIFILASVIVVAFLMSTIIAHLQSKKTIWKKGNASIVLRYGDLQKISLPKKKLLKTKEQIVVISVNTHFDMIVNDKLVSASSVHGQWVNWMKDAGISPKDLNYKIKQSAKSLGIQPIRNDIQKQGNTEAYERGTIIELKHNNTRFFLTALSEFDHNLNAQTSRDDLIDVIRTIINYYDMHGNGQPIYIPLIGTELSRTNLSEQESLKLLSDMFQLYSDKIHSTVTIVVYNKHRNQVTIF